MSCTGCRIGYFESIRVFHRRQQCLEVLKSHGIKIPKIKCPECDEPPQLVENNTHWSCQNGHDFERFVRPEDWLESLHLTPAKCCIFMSLYVLTDVAEREILKRDLRIHSHLSYQWSLFMHEVCQDWCLHNSSKELGGPNSIVEMFEGELENRYGNRHIQGKWIFSAYEKHSRHFFFQVVPERSSPMLVAVIKQRIRPGTKILFTPEMAYYCLSDEGFDCLKASYNISWIDPHTKICTQVFPETIGRDEPCTSGYIGDILFRKRIDDQEFRIHHFLIAVKHFIKRNRDIPVERIVDNDEQLSWTSVIFLLFCFVYSMVASIIFYKFFIPYGTEPSSNSSSSNNNTENS